MKLDTDTQNIDFPEDHHCEKRLEVCSLLHFIKKCNNKIHSFSQSPNALCKNH